MGVKVHFVTRYLVRWFTVGFVVPLLGVVLVAPAAGAAVDPCLTAAGQLAAGDVKGTRATIAAQVAATGQTDSCAAVRTRADDQETTAAALAALAQKAQAAAQWTQAAALADNSLALDSSNAAAKAVKTAAAVEIAAYAKRVAAADEADRSWLEALKADWDAFYTDQLAPLAAVLLPLLLLWLSLFTAARLLVLARERWKPTDGDDLKAWRHLLLTSGIVGLAAGSFTLTVTFADLVQAPGTQLTVWSAGSACLAAGVLTAAVGAGATLKGTSPSPVLVCVGLAVAGMALIGLIVHAYHAWNWPAPLDRATLALLGTVTSLVGVWMAAWWLATRLRLSVTVGAADGKDDTSQADAVVALLGELGLEKPRGLEVPNGADVTALSGAFSSLPDNVLLKHLKSLVVDAAGFTPWTVQVSGSDTSRSVTVRRNGRTVASTVIEIGHLLPSAPASSAGEASSASKKDDAVAKKEPDAAVRLVAAFVLTTLAHEHVSVAKGLAGAADWRSVGLQYIATADWADDSHKDLQKQALAKALNFDPGNLAARLAYRHAQDRTATDAEVLLRYGCWLDQFIEDCKRYPALRLRARYTRTVIAINRAYAVAAESADAAARDAVASAEKLKRALDKLNDDLNAKPARSVELSGLVSQLNSAAHPLFLLCGLADRNAIGPPSSPIEMYNLACFYASRHERLTAASADQTQVDDDATAVALLQLAQSDPVDATWYLDDPQLSGFRTRSAYRTAFLAGPRQDFFEIGHLTPFAEKLRAAGYVNPVLLADADPYQVRQALKTTRAVATLAVSAAELHVNLASTKSTKPWAVEAIDELAARDLISLASVRGLSRRQKKTMARDIGATLAKKARAENEGNADEDKAARRLRKALDEWLSVP